MGKILGTMTTLAWLTMAPAAVYAQASITGTVRDASDALGRGGCQIPLDVGDTPHARDDGRHGWVLEDEPQGQLGQVHASGHQRPESDLIPERFHPPLVNFRASYR